MLPSLPISPERSKETVDNFAIIRPASFIWDYILDATIAGDNGHEMSYFHELFIRAWSDTWSLVVGSPAIALVITGGILVIAVVLHYFRKGLHDAKDVIFAAIETAAATIFVFAVVFYIHLIIISPKNIVEEARLALSKKPVISNPPTKFDTADYELRQTVRTYEAKVKSLEAELLNAKRDATTALSVAERANLASKPKPIKERLRKCLEEIDPRITEVAKTRKINFTGEVNMQKVEDLQKLAAEPESTEFLIINSVKNGSGMSIGNEQISGNQYIDIIVLEALMK